MEIKIKSKETINLHELLKRNHFTDDRIKQIQDNIYINDKKVDLFSLVFTGSIVKVILPNEVNYIVPTKKNLDIVYEDEYFICVKKEQGVDIHPTKANYTNTLSNYVSYYYLENNIKSGIHLVNRLDKDTSGLVIFAKNGYIHYLFSLIKITKLYYAICQGVVHFGLINVKIEKGTDGIKRIVSPNGKISLTLYRRIKRIGNNSFVRIKLLTGRTHQIRVSFKHIGHPLVGDKLYNENSSGSFYLSAYKLSFKHPITKNKIKIEI